jgi:hypothetical protein
VQSTWNNFAAAVIAIAAVSVNSAAASDAVVTITAAGEAFEGPPKFLLKADGVLIGEALINASVETAGGARVQFRDNKIEGETERFTFTVPAIENVRQLDVEFVNDHWAGEGKTGDRNMFVTGITVGDAVISPSALKPVTENQSSAEIAAEWAALYSAGMLRLVRPAEGWISASSPAPSDINAEQQAMEKSEAPAKAEAGSTEIKKKTRADVEAAEVSAEAPKTGEMPSADIGKIQNFSSYPSAWWRRCEIPGGRWSDHMCPARKMRE